MEEKHSLGHVEHIKKSDITGRQRQIEHPIKVVFLGAGSAFLENLFIDLTHITGNYGGEISLVEIDAKRLELALQLGQKIIEKTSGKWSISGSSDRRKILSNADYIINCIEVNGINTVKLDNDIPAKYGINQCIGDTIGPGGLMKALRTVPVFLEVLKDIEEFCPNAMVLNYTNPMSIMCLSASRKSRVKIIGLCHSVQGTSHLLADYVGIPYEELSWRCGGINHLSWFTELSSRGENLYPLLFDKAFGDKEFYEKDPIRFDMMKHFGYFITESSGHLSEYLPYYRKRTDLIEKYCRKEYLGENGFYSKNWPTWRKKCDQRRIDLINGNEQFSLDRSWEYASCIIQAIETNSPYVIYGTVPNHGLIENLQADGVVEVACLVDGRGVQPTRFGILPPQCAAICSWNMRMYDLAAIACTENSREAAIHALMLDPLTAAVCCPSEIKQMAEELIEAEKEFLPQF